MPTGLGGEELWLSPTVANNVNPFDDQSGNGNNGTGQGGISTISDTGAGGSFAYDCDGVNDYIDCGSGISLSGSNLSIAFWLKADVIPTQNNVYVTLMAKGNESGITPFDISFAGIGQATNLRFFTYDGSLNGITSYTTSMSTAQWYHVCGVYDNQDFKLYVDGLSVATQSYTGGITDNSANINVAALEINAAPQRYFNGKLDDARLYKRAITQSEITHLATSRGVLGPPGGDNYSPFRNAKYINRTYQIPRFG